MNRPSKPGVASAQGRVKGHSAALYEGGVGCCLPLTTSATRGTLEAMVVACLLGMIDPVGPVSEQNPVSSTPEIESWYFVLSHRLVENTA
jgi:hypothetical protein